MQAPAKARLLLVLITVIWGSTFPLSKMVLAQLPPFYYLSIRYGLATLIMLALFRRSVSASWKSTWHYSLPIGIVLGLAYLGQTAGIDFTTASKAGFLTGLSVVLVPLLQALWTKRLPSMLSMGSAGIATLGLALLSNLFSEHVDLNNGDMMVLFSAVMFAFHILLWDRLPSNQVRETVVCQQFLVTALISLALGLATETWPMQGVTLPVVGIVLFLCLIATVFAYIGQSWAQQHLSATNTALILILEPVFSALFSWAWLNEQLGMLGWLGALCIVGGMVASSMEPSST